MAIYTKLHQLQCAVRGLGKDANGGQYNYVSGSKLLPIIREEMDKLGLLLKQEIINIHNERQDYTVGRDNRPKSEILTTISMRFTWVDVETGETDVNTFAANGQNDWEKGLGSALTYGERYFLLKYFHIPTDEDDCDNINRKKEEQDTRKALPESMFGDDRLMAWIAKNAKPATRVNIGALINGAYKGVTEKDIDVICTNYIEYDRRNFQSA